jgi:guanylate kinase
VKRRLHHRGLIFVISGPSGSGKTTLAQNLIKSPELKERLARSISFATRPKRAGEIDGKDYFFITERQFKQRLKAKKILEWTKYLGYYYATPKDFIEKQLKNSKHITLCLDLRGALKIKRLYPKNTVMIFVIPPSLEELRKRIQKRSNQTKKTEIHQRLKLAKQELLAANRYDYRLVNKDLGQVINQLKKIILNKIGP